MRSSRLHVFFFKEKSMLNIKDKQCFDSVFRSCSILLVSEEHVGTASRALSSPPAPALLCPNPPAQSLHCGWQKQLLGWANRPGGNFFHWAKATDASAAPAESLTVRMAPVLIVCMVTVVALTVVQERDLCWWLNCQIRPLQQEQVVSVYLYTTNNKYIMGRVFCSFLFFLVSST